MALLSVPMLAETRKLGVDLYPLIDISFPGVTKRWASAAYPSASRGQYEGKILQWGTITEATSDRDGALQTFPTSITFDDTDQFFGKLLAGPSGRLIRGSPAVIRLAAPPPVAPSDWAIRFAGIVAGYSQGWNRWTLTLRNNDTPLQRNFPKTFVTRVDFPNASASVLAQPAPLIYGKHSSVGLSDNGMVPTLLVDTLLFRYLLCAGQIKSLDAVYKDGVKVSSGYSLKILEPNGRRYSVIEFTTSQGTSVITADVQGYESVGDGTGSLIENPADVLSHIMKTWVYSDHQTGNWPPDSAGPFVTSLAMLPWVLNDGLPGQDMSFDPTVPSLEPAYWALNDALPHMDMPFDLSPLSITRTFLGNRGYRASLRIAGSPRRGIDLLNEFCKTHHVASFWTNLGLLAILPEDPSTTAIYPVDAWLRGDIHELGEAGSFRYEFDESTVLSRLATQFLYSAAQDQFLYALESRDTTIPDDAADSLELSWSYAALS